MDGAVVHACWGFHEGCFATAGFVPDAKETGSCCSALPPECLKQSNKENSTSHAPLLRALAVEHIPGQRASGLPGGEDRVRQGCQRRQPPHPRGARLRRRVGRWAGGRARRRARHTAPLSERLHAVVQVAGGGRTTPVAVWGLADRIGLLPVARRRDLSDPRSGHLVGGRRPRPFHFQLPTPDGFPIGCLGELSSPSGTRQPQPCPPPARLVLVGAVSPLGAHTPRRPWSTAAPHSPGALLRLGPYAPRTLLFVPFRCASFS